MLVISVKLFGLVDCNSTAVMLVISVKVFGPRLFDALAKTLFGDASSVQTTVCALL